MSSDDEAAPRRREESEEETEEARKERKRAKKERKRLRKERKKAKKDKTRENPDSEGGAKATSKQRIRVTYDSDEEADRRRAKFTFPDDDNEIETVREKKRHKSERKKRKRPAAPIAPSNANAVARNGKENIDAKEKSDSDEESSSEEKSSRDNTKTAAPRLRSRNEWRGVYAKKNSFESRIYVNRVPEIIGSFKTVEEAAQAYDNRAREVHGSNAKTNFDEKGNRNTIHHSSMFRGVNWNKNREKWGAYIKIANKLHYLGLYDEEKEAAKAYDIMALKYHKEKAIINFPEEIEESIRIGLTVNLKNVVE